KVAVIPHYDNAEGGTHDTRFCYLGERRLAVLERELPDDAAVLGVDEHTALIIDLTTAIAEVVGRGGATIRKAGVSTILPAGTRTTLDDLRTLVRSGTPADGTVTARQDLDGDGAAGQPGKGGDESQPGRALNDVTADAERRFVAANLDRDSATMVAAILDLEAAIEAWSTDTDENDDSDRARAVLRGLVARLGRAAEQGLVDPAERLRPAIEPLITLRETLRKDRAYAAADVIRDALAAAGVDLRDTPDGTRWEITTA
ncbi:MAG: CysS/YqeB C-terminal domain-containing protein, partial [Streptosporangiaceae bacterium]